MVTCVSRAPNAVILMYHRIAADDSERGRWCISPREFAQHMAHLKQECVEVVSLEYLGDAVRRRQIPDRCVAITFDDGYLDSLTDAAPILALFAFSATFFVISDSICGSDEFWWDALMRIFLSGGPLPERLVIEVEAGKILELDTRTADERRAARIELRDALLFLDSGHQNRAIRTILDWSGVGMPPAGAARAMSLAELRRLQRIPGMDVGSHTETHLLLPSHPATVKRRELRHSKARLERALGRVISTLAYPYGQSDAETVRLASEAGYETAVSIGERSVTLSSDPLRLPRYGVRASDDFPARLTRAFSHRDALSSPTG